MDEQLHPQSNWSEIPQDILLKISKSLKIYSDYIHLRAVCRHWHTILPSKPPKTLPCQLPWLLLPPSNPATGNSRRIFNILTNKLYSLSILESSYPRRILGSSHGYLIISSGTPEIFCLNPITNSKVTLPSLSSLPGVVSFSFSNLGREYLIQDQFTHQIYFLDLQQMRDDFIRKLVLSSPPSSGSQSQSRPESPTLVFAIVTSFLTKTTELVFCTTLDDKWNWVPVSDFTAEDVIYCESDGLFYAVNKNGDIGSFKISVGGICEVVSIWNSVDLMRGDLKYLVLIDDEMILLTRNLGSEADLITYCELYKTVGFEVFRFSKDGVGRVRWVPVPNIEDWMVFVGESSSVALLASDFRGCRGNHIYFTDDHSKCNDVGVFDIGEKCTDALSCFPDDVILPLYWQSPIWITPNPH
ncbi:unnamed protein product [Amaranthus hypochondriacus]